MGCLDVREEVSIFQTRLETVDDRNFKVAPEEGIFIDTFQADKGMAEKRGTYSWERSRFIDFNKTLGIPIVITVKRFETPH